MAKHRMTWRTRVRSWVSTIALAYSGTWAKPGKQPSAAQSYDADGTNLVPRVQTPAPRRYTAPQDIELYEAHLGGHVFEFELMPEEPGSIIDAAYRAARELYGVYVDSQPITDIEAMNGPARRVLPVPYPRSGLQ